MRQIKAPDRWRSAPPGLLQIGVAMFIGFSWLLLLLHVVVSSRFEATANSDLLHRPMATGGRGSREAPATKLESAMSELARAD